MYFGTFAPNQKNYQKISDSLQNNRLNAARVKRNSPEIQKSNWSKRGKL